MLVPNTKPDNIMITKSLQNKLLPLKSAITGSNAIKQIEAYSKKKALEADNTIRIDN